MAEDIINKIIPLIGILVFIGAFVYVRKTNPENKKIRTRTSFSAIKRKEICPRCGVKMKKKWVTRSLGLSMIESDSVYEEDAEPEFTCPKCGYKIEADFSQQNPEEFL